MDPFDEWLLSKGIDCVGLTRELRAALLEQFKAEQRAVEPVTEVLVIPESVDERWSRALRVPVCGVGA